MDLSKNALFRVDPDANIFINNDSEIVMWVINPNGDICIIEPEQFSKESSNKDIVIFKTRAYNKTKGVKLLKKLIDVVG